MTSEAPLSWARAAARSSACSLGTERSQPAMIVESLRAVTAWSVSQTGFVEQPEGELRVRHALLRAHALVEPELRINPYAEVVLIAHACGHFTERRDRALEVRVVVDRFIE